MNALDQLLQEAAVEFETNGNTGSNVLDRLDAEFNSNRDAVIDALNRMTGPEQGYLVGYLNLPFGDFDVPEPDKIAVSGSRQ